MGIIGVGLFLAAPAGARLHLAGSFQLQGTHGYSVRVIAHRAGLPIDARKSESRHRVGKVTVIARKLDVTQSSGELASASYTAPARFNKHRIRANLGGFGRVRLRFHGPVGLLSLPPNQAAAQQRRIAVCAQSGVFVSGGFRGTFRFRGEGGYTAARTHRVHGRIERDSPVRCHGHDRAIELKARSGSTRFIALSDLSYAANYLVASTRGESGRVEIARKVGRAVAASAGEFTFDQDLTTAHVEPGGGLFTGSADYTAGNWTGSLAVSFPGQPDVPLTGPDFEATLRSGKYPAGALSLP